MPLYEYKCKRCKHVFEEFERNYSKRVRFCPKCGKESNRIMSAYGLLRMQLDDFPTTDKGKRNDDIARGMQQLPLGR